MLSYFNYLKTGNSYELYLEKSPQSKKVFWVKLQYFQNLSLGLSASPYQ